MNRTFAILKRLNVVLGYIVAALAVHLGVRALWAFAGLGDNLNTVTATGRVITSTQSGETLSKYVFNENYGTEVPRTLANFNTPLTDIFLTHFVALLVIAVTVAIITGLVQLITWVITGHGLTMFTKTTSGSTDANDDENDEDDDIVNCRDPRCSCAYHFDEKYDDDSGTWVTATADEEADRYVKALSAR